jgi:hypothetical protein
VVVGGCRRRSLSLTRSLTVSLPLIYYITLPNLRTLITLITLIGGGAGGAGGGAGSLSLTLSLLTLIS